MMIPKTFYLGYYFTPQCIKATSKALFNYFKVFPTEKLVENWIFVKTRATCLLVILNLIFELQILCWKEIFVCFSSCYGWSENLKFQYVLSGKWMFIRFDISLSYWLKHIRIKKVSFKVSYFRLYSKYQT